MMSTDRMIRSLMQADSHRETVARLEGFLNETKKKKKEGYGKL